MDHILKFGGLEMEITVRDICILQSLKTNMDLIAGKDGLDRVVTSVSVMEVPDFADGSLVAGLFVLTTLYNFSKDERQMVEIVRKLAKNQVSGIVIKINRFIDKIPSSVIEEADKHHLPLFHMEGLLFSNVISVITSEIISNEFNKIKTANEYYQEIFLALLNGEKITSFTIDHIKLQPGVYVSRKDPVGNSVITTFDIRMTSPNEEPVMNTAELHTIEHLAATFLRNHKEFGPKMIYWGPMGCRTGNYLLLNGDYESKDIVPLMVETFEFIRDFQGEVPGASPKDCGNYLDMNLGMAKYLAKKFLAEV